MKTIFNLFFSIIIVSVLSCSSYEEATPFYDEKLEEELLHLITSYRTLKNLPELVVDDLVRREAQIFSRDLAANFVEYSHASFETVQESLKVSYGADFECIDVIGYGPNEPDILFGVWLQKERDSAIIEGNYNTIGIGIVNRPGDDVFFYTVIFANMPE